MAADYVLHYLCAPKEQFGDGDPVVGTTRILQAIKARNRAVFLAELTAREGRDPRGQTLALRTVGPGGQPVDVELKYEDLRAEGNRLLPFESDCAGCPANVMGQPFGCIGVVNYPIPRSAEEWMMNRLQTAATVGGKLFLSAIEDFGYTGEPIQGFRSQGLFASKQPVSRNLGRGAGQVVTSNQLFQALFCIPETLDPGHCLGVLLWLDALTLDGTPATEPAQAIAISRLETPADRLARVHLNLGALATDPGVAAMQRLVRTLYASWVYDARIGVWA